MAPPQAAALDQTFFALSDPTRRAILSALADAEDATVSELAAPFDMSLPGFMKHLAVLTDAGLVTREKFGRTVRCRLAAGPMREAMAWLHRYETFWTDRLDALGAYLEDETCPTPPLSPSSTRPAPSRRASRSSVATASPARRSGAPGQTPKR